MLSEETYDLVLEFGFIEELNFFWDEEFDEVRYEAPEIPDDWKTRDEYSMLDSWSTVSSINEEVDRLGETVANLLTDYYVDWETEADIVETYGDQYNGRDDAEPEQRQEDSRYE